MSHNGFYSQVYIYLGHYGYFGSSHFLLGSGNKAEGLFQSLHDTSESVKVIPDPDTDECQLLHKGKVCLYHAEGTCLTQQNWHVSVLRSLSITRKAKAAPGGHCKSK